MRIVTSNVADSATLSSSAFVSTLPVTNLQLEGRTRVARSTNAGGPVVINGNWAAPQSVACALLYRHNLTANATWRVRIFAGKNQLGTVLFDSQDQPPFVAVGWGDFGWGGVGWGQNAMSGWDSPFCVLWFPAVTALSFSVTLTDVGNPAGYLQAKRLLIGPYMQPLVNASYGLQIALRDSSQQTRTGAGGLRTEAEAQWRALNFSLDALNGAERAALLDIARTVGVRKEVFISVFHDQTDSNARDYAMLGKFTQAASTQTATQFGRHSQQIIFEEA